MSSTQNTWSFDRDHKELMTKYKTLGMDDACSREELEKAKEKLKDLEKLKKKLLKLETAKEMKDNEVLRAPKASKKLKDSLNDTFTPQDTINEPDVCLRKPKRLRVTENIIKSTNKDGTSSCIIIDDDDDDVHTPNVSTSFESPSYDSVLQPTNRAKTNDDVAFVHEIKQDKHLSNITNELSLPALSSQKGNSAVC
ncbi:hypothetical protein HanHA300_Chr04g0149671 [Helianthus annuus]|nr:hypothetical protein HanHA300_Chr04g0149671 [Helianthus annuus]KAJ0758820.1 hypothetical protein HanLR1_Chr04g0154621 [Helianthus annuus]